MRFVILTILILALPSPLFAVMEYPNLGEPLLVDVSPTTIAPSDRVTVTVESYLMDLDRSTLSWYLDGVLDKSGRGIKTFSFTAGPIGTESVVEVRVVSDQGLTAAFTTRVRPVELALLWEADSYTPPLYRGRALPSPGTTVVAQAVARFLYPDGVELKPEELIYTWRFNGSILPDSGSGRDVVRIPIDGLYGSDTLSAEVVSPDGTFRGIHTVSIEPTTPLLRLYRFNPLLGIDYPDALAHESEFNESETKIAAIPFFALAASLYERALSFSWAVGGQDVKADSEKPFLITLGLPEGESAETTLALGFARARSVLQNVSDTWLIRLLPGAGSIPAIDPFSRSFE